MTACLRGAPRALAPAGSVIAAALFFLPRDPARGGRPPAFAPVQQMMAV